VTGTQDTGNRHPVLHRDPRLGRRLEAKTGSGVERQARVGRGS
jgi:hypothetical protein